MFYLAMFHKPKELKHWIFLQYFGVFTRPDCYYKLTGLSAAELQAKLESRA